MVYRETKNDATKWSDSANAYPLAAQLNHWHWTAIFFLGAIFTPALHHHSRISFYHFVTRVWCFSCFRFHSIFMYVNVVLLLPSKHFNVNGLKVNPSSDPCSKAQCDKWFDSICRCVSCVWCDNVAILLTWKRVRFVYFLLSFVTSQTNCSRLIAPEMTNPGKSDQNIPLVRFT